MSSSPVVTHIAFGCRNISAQEVFYTKHFGFKRSRTFHRGEPNEFFMLKLGSMRLELFPPGADLPKDAAGCEQKVGFRHLAFEVARLEPVIEALRADGIQVEPIIELPQLGEGFRIVFFCDPEGNRLELMEGFRDEE